MVQSSPGSMEGRRTQKTHSKTTAYVAVAALAAMALALLVLPPAARPEERLVAGASKHSAHGGAAAAHKRATDKATEKAVLRIQKKMMKSLDIAAPGDKEAKDPTQDTRDSILREDNDIASLKLATGNLFAKWEKARTQAEDAKTKAVSLHEELSQDKTKERLEQQKLSTLQAKLAQQLSAHGGSAGSTGAGRGKQAGESTGASRSDIKQYWAKLNKKDAAQEKAAHRHSAQQAAAARKASAAAGAAAKKAAKVSAHKAVGGGVHAVRKAQAAHVQVAVKAKGAVAAGGMHAIKAAHGAKAGAKGGRKQ